MTTDRLTLTPIHWDENIKVLRDFKNTLKTSMGPAGCVKVLVTGGDFLQLTATSASLIARLDLEHPICRYIGHVASGLPDFGLYFGVIVSHLVELLWAHKSFPKQKLSTSVQTLLEFVQQILSCDHVCSKVDFSSVNSFLPLVRSVISSKSPTFLFDMSINSFCIEVVKAFLNSIDDQTNSAGRVCVKVETGPSSFSSHNGLLYQVFEEHDIKIIKELEGEVKILIFTVKLDNSDNKSCISVIDQAMTILKQAVELNVRLVACQKTVAAEIKLYLMRQKVVLMDRMGTELTESLVYTSRGFPVSQLCFDHHLSDVSKLLGTLTSVKNIQFNESNYILLQEKNVSVATLLIQNYCLAGADHLKTLTQQAISSLRYLALHPTLTFGGGCLEIWLIAQIHILKESQTDKEFHIVSHWMQLALLSACGSTSPDSMDSVYHHGWADESLRCRCGLVTAAELDEAGGQLISLEELVNTQSVGPVSLNPPRQSTAVMPSDVLVDSHQQKLNVLVSAVETFANLSDIGFIVYKD